MKLLTTLVAVLLLSASYATAQDLNGLSATSIHSSSSSDITGFRAPNGPGVNPHALNTPPNPKVILKPQLGGVFVDGFKYGTIMISPWAPASYGMGEKYLSAPSTREDLQHESAQAAHRTTGGLKLFSFEF